MNSNQGRELGCSAAVFNLAGERGQDPDRMEREKCEAEQRRRDAAVFEETHQRRLAECPGFVGADAPAGPGAEGRVVVEPRFAGIAKEWLAHRYAVNEDLSLDEIADGIVFEIRARSRPGKHAGKTRRMKFGGPEQFRLALE